MGILTPGGDNFGPCTDFSAFGLGVAGVQHDEPRIFNPAIGVFIAANEFVFQRFAGDVGSQINAAGGRENFASTKIVIEKQANADQESWTQAIMMGQNKAQRPNDVGSGFQQDFPLDQGFAHQPEFIVFEITQSAVDQLG